MNKAIKAEAKTLRRYDSDGVINVISKISVWRRSDEPSFAKALAKEGLDYKRALRDFQLAFAFKLAMYFYNKPRFPQKQINLKTIMKACRALAEHQIPVFYPVKSIDGLEKFMIRISYQQFPDFFGDADTMARTHLLFKTCAETVGEEIGFNVNAAYREATGLTLKQSWDITLALYGLLTEKRGGIQSGPIKSGELSRNISDSDIARFVSMISLTPEDFLDKMKLPEFQLDPFETFNPNPLVNWPIVILSKQRWVVPILPYLFRRGTEQAFYDVIAYRGREFSGFFGYVFENYTDKILTTLHNNYEIFPQRQYQYKGNTCDTCDRIIIKDGNAVLLECKTKRLGLKTKLTADESLLRNDITDIGKEDDTGNVVHAIRQLYLTEQAIRGNCSGLEELNKKVTGKMYPLVLVLDPYNFANSPYIKRIINEELGKGDTPINDYDWQILDARGFEPLCALAQKEDFISLIEQKFSALELKVQDMKTYIDNYIVKKGYTDRNVIWHPVLATELEIFSKELEARYKLDTESG